MIFKVSGVLAALSAFLSIFCMPLAMLTNWSLFSWWGLFLLSLTMIFMFPVFVKIIIEIFK